MSHIQAAQLLAAAQQFLKLGQTQRAIDALNRSLAIAPQSFPAHSLLGIAYHTTGNSDGAIRHLQAALALLPSWTEGHALLGTVFSNRGSFEQAVTEFRHVLRLKPQNVEAMNNLGTVLKSLSRYEESITILRQAAALQPDRAEIRNNLGNSLLESGQTVEALVELQRAVELRPDYVLLYQGLGNSLVSLGKIPEAIDCFRRALRIDPKHHQIHSSLLMSMQYTDDAEENPHALLQENRKYSAIHIHPLPRPTSYANDPNPGRRLRIGYFSPDFRQHSVAYFFEPLLAHHDPAAVETYCYADVGAPDAVTARLEKLAAHWQTVTGQTDQQIADLILADQIDILIDLAGHTGGGRLPMLGRKPAPVQATYLGYPDRTGVETIDYRIVDSITDPPASPDEAGPEKLFRLDPPFLCFQPPADSPDVSALPAMSNGHLTFGSFNALPKITPGTIRLWAGAMTAVPNSRLLMKARGLQNAEVADRIAAQFQLHHVDPARLTLIGHEKTTASHLARYHQIDIALDPFPYQGTTTTCEALYMGVPVITQTGSTHASRVGASILTTIGQPNWIAHSAEQFTRIAKELAEDQTKLAAHRARLRGQFINSPMTDAEGLARKLEAAFAVMWKSWTQLHPTVLPR
jgi:predicted O-linked N-acetylglucosamine transferase (SPINDLY family)